MLTSGDKLICFILLQKPPDKCKSLTEGSQSVETGTMVCFLELGDLTHLQYVSGITAYRHGN